MANKTYDKESIKSQLKAMYPDKIVTNLSIKDKSFYNIIQYHAKVSGLSNKEFISSLGFEMNPKVNDPKAEVKCNRCANILPKNYKGKSCLTCRVERKLEDKAKRKKRKSEKSCTTCGIKLPENSQYSQCQECRDYVSENVMRLRNERIKNHQCEDCGVELGENYLNRKCPSCKIKSYSYKTVSEDPDSNLGILYTPEYITSLISEYYGDKPIYRMQQDYPNLYHAIYRNAIEKKMTFKKYVEGLGFKVKKREVKKVCSVKGCTNKHYAKGLCSVHYQQMRTSNI